MTEICEKMTEICELEKEEQLLNLAIEYATTGLYQPHLTKDQKRAVRRKARTLVVESGEVFIERKKGRVKVIAAKAEQARVLRSCHSEPTSGHFGTTKTWRRIAERFYWKGMADDVKQLVSNHFVHAIHSLMFLCV